MLTTLLVLGAGFGVGWIVLLLARERPGANVDWVFFVLAPGLTATSAAVFALASTPDSLAGDMVFFSFKLVAAFLALITALYASLWLGWRNGRRRTSFWRGSLGVYAAASCLVLGLGLQVHALVFSVASGLAAFALGLSMVAISYVVVQDVALLIKGIRLRRSAAVNASERPETVRARKTRRFVSEAPEQAEAETESEAPLDGLLDQHVASAHAFERPELSQLTALIRCETPPWAAIGLVGIRGVGKTMLQRQLLDNLDDDQSLTFSVACPAGDAPEKEIVTNIFDRLCHAVLARFRREFEKEIPGLREVALGKHSRYKRRIMRTAGMIQGLLLGGGAAYALFRFALLNLEATAQVGFAVAGGAAVATTVVAAWLSWGSRGRLLPIESQILRAASRSGRRDPSPEEVALLYARTMREISRLEADQKLTTAASQSLQPWSGASFSRSHQTETRQLALTLPGLIDAYIAYVERGVRTCYKRVVVVIDELDRIADPEVIRKFLRSLKSLFQVAGTYYVMSVSQDVIESFDLQSVAEKGETDSAFTEIVRLRPFSVGEGIQFLRSLGQEGTPRSYAAITTLAAGIPRDILRYQRLYRSYAEHTEQSEACDQQGTYLRFIDVVDERWKEAFLRHVRHSARFSPREKQFFAEVVGRCKVIGPKSVLMDILPQISSSEWSAERQGSDVSAMILAVQYLIRVCIVAELRGLRTDDKDALEATLGRVCKAMEIHSYSPLEALKLIAD